MPPEIELKEGGGRVKEAVVTVELETLPEVPEAKIDKLKLERHTVEADDAAVDKALVDLAQGQKSFDPAKPAHKAGKGDLVLMDFEGKVDGEPFEGGKGEGMSIEIGSGRLIPGFEDQLIGAKANEQRPINVTFPPDHHAQSPKGKDSEDPPVGK